MNEFDDRARTWDADPLRRELTEAVARAIRARVPLDRSMHVFEYGCGTGLLSFALHEYAGAMTLADSSAGMLQVCAENIAAAGIACMHTRILDLTVDPPPDTPVDLLCTQMALHHVRDTDTLLRAFARMVRPGGYLCIADLEREDGSFHGPEFDGHHGFDPAALAAQVAAAGFTDCVTHTCYVLRRERQGRMRAYPVFLLSATRAGTSTDQHPLAVQRHGTAWRAARARRSAPNLR